ncbi:pyrroline-5-carboxylate reductase [Phyllobacterium zundukense]|uniref:Pyrroline-5-carboxylate reductase n=1 Tax=Phyllobacterium zundukense TaxID=1867719 RepID=A0A2N9VYD8_9HYPH|nr:pyrroline-5-carboxylate reductase [Phyllobacterium zundukense]ATU95094.1 pyrroline-5-carboxylate reductase [Phyllobacterium zundukense]PIO44506.1 pyrroline-5-carboxylate reductase [Phyllobacterium zundukense]
MGLGFIGTGTMAAAIVEGLGGGEILVSPRGAALAADLTARFAGVKVADSNQSVVDGSETVVLAVRPQVAEEVIRELRFRPDQRVISVIAATPIDRLREWIGLDLSITRAIPLPFVAARRGVTPIFPPNAEAAELFNKLGTAVPCHTIEEFDLLAVGSALMGSYFGVLETVQGWLSSQGLSETASRTYLAGLFASLGETAEASSSDFAALRDEYSTKGGLNEQMFRVFAEQGGTAAMNGALTSVLTRIRG